MRQGIIHVNPTADFAAGRLPGAEMNARDTLRLLSEHLPEIRRRFGVRELAIFGSVARDEARPGSDLDVLVEFAARPNFDDFFGLKLHLEEVWGARVDLAQPADLHPALRARIESEARRVS